MISGAVAGLGTITPASGFVAPWHGIVIGVIAGLVCFWACTWLKRRFDYDDSLDVFGVHGVGGMTGTLLAGVFATASIGGTSGLIEGNPQLLLIQLYGVGGHPRLVRRHDLRAAEAGRRFRPAPGIAASRRWKASIFRSMARRCSKDPASTAIPFRLPLSMGSDYVRSSEHAYIFWPLC